MWTEKQLLNTTGLAACFLALFGVAEFLYRRLHWRVEVTRKIVHIGTGLLTLLFPLLLHHHGLVLLLCGTFAVILLLSQRLKLLPSINAIDRDSFGSISYPIAVYGCYLVYAWFNMESESPPYFWFYVPVLVMAVCDPAAAFVGKTFAIGRFNVRGETKTLSGCAAFFTTACLLCFLLLSSTGYNASLSFVLLSTLVLALVTTLTEAVSSKGLDNLTIPCAALAVLFLLNRIAP